MYKRSISSRVRIFTAKHYYSNKIAIVCIFNFSLKLLCRNLCPPWIALALPLLNVSSTGYYCTAWFRLSPFVTWALQIFISYWKCRAALRCGGCELRRIWIADAPHISNFTSKFLTIQISTVDCGSPGGWCSPFDTTLRLRIAALRVAGAPLLTPNCGCGCGFWIAAADCGSKVNSRQINPQILLMHPIKLLKIMLRLWKTQGRNQPSTAGGGGEKNFKWGHHLFSQLTIIISQLQNLC